MDGLGTQYLFVTIADTNTLMKRVVAHSPLWKKFFSAEASALSEKLGATLMASHHIGSTAVPNLPAKPIIDILLEVTSVSLLDKKSSTLESRGYDIRGEYGIEGRRYFKRQPVGGVPGFHVHAYEAGSYQVQRHLAFRNYLRLRPEVAAEYAEIKRSLSDSNGILASGYQETKKSWVDAISLEALSHFTDKD